MYRVLVIFPSDDMAKIVLKSCETCNASTLLYVPTGDVKPRVTQCPPSIQTNRMSRNKENDLD